ncbi:MAG: hypothetical protein SVU32_04525 [Candidatus Nanohaloarchaea archaeon]|nr:hypothetical protein [Candidatus Nanohaloarchaea archaeon]
MPELTGSWSRDPWILHRVDGPRELYLLVNESASRTHIALSGEELERLAGFLERIVEEVNDMQEQQVVDDVDRGGRPPFLVARSYNEPGWRIEFYAEPDYEDENAVPFRTLNLSNVKIRDWADSGFLRR